MRYKLLSMSALVALFSVGCAGTIGSEPPPRTAKNAVNDGYPGPCSQVELDVLETAPPASDVAAPNLGENALEVVATYRPGDKPKRPTDVVSFRERREREDDPEAQLRQQTFAVCGGEATGTPTGTVERGVAPNAEPSATPIPPEPGDIPPATDNQR